MPGENKPDACDCDFRALSHSRFSPTSHHCTAKGHEGNRPVCRPDACGYWRDHLRLAALEKKFADLFEPASARPSSPAGKAVA